MGSEHISCGEYVHHFRENNLQKHPWFSNLLTKFGNHNCRYNQGEGGDKIPPKWKNEHGVDILLEEIFNKPMTT